MSSKQESAMSSIAAVLVLFTTMLDPVISAGLAVALLMAFAVYKHIQSRSH